MLYACYGRPGGQLVTPEKFMALAGPNFRAKGVLPYCPSCDDAVDPYGVHSPQVTSRFDHQNINELQAPWDDCLEANRSGRYRGMHADGWDYSRGEALRKQFFELDNICQAYAFCLSLCRKGNLSVPEFKALISRADRKKIWAYQDIPLWVIPYILLTLGNFGTGPQSRFPFHFVLSKSQGKGLSQIWQPDQKCYIKKVFSASGDPVKTSDNPLAISHLHLEEKAGDYGWVSSGPVGAALDRI